MTEELGKAIAIEVKGKSSWRDLVPAARSVARGIRKMQGEGYDLRSYIVKAYMIRNDRVLEPPCELRPSAYDEGLVETRRRR
jgi:hypothetical protein